MNIVFEVAIPGLISGIIIGSAFVVSKFIRTTLIACSAILIIWILIESGDGGVVRFFESIYYDHILNEQMFFIPLIIGLIVSVLFIHMARK